MNGLKSMVSFSFSAKSKYGDFSVVGFGCEIRMVLIFWAMRVSTRLRAVKASRPHLPHESSETCRRYDFEGAKVGKTPTQVYPFAHDADQNPGPLQD